MVKNVSYDVSLALPKGDKYFGWIKIEFEYQNSNKRDDTILSFPLVNKNYEIILSETAEKRNIDFKHSQIDQADFHSQRLLPRKISESSPKIITWNFNNDDLTDFVISNSKGASPKLFLQTDDGKFNEYDLFDPDHYNQYNYEDLIWNYFIIILKPHHIGRDTLN